MIKRTISSASRLSISRPIRGPSLEREVWLSLHPEGILISKDRPQDAPNDERFFFQSYFDQYNRIYLPEALCAAAHLQGQILIEPHTDGTLLLVPNAHAFCAVCGGSSELRRMGPDKLLCNHCIAKAMSAELEKEEDHEAVLS